MIYSEGGKYPPLRVVALGGGHGLAASLQAVRRYAADITAIVSVADDGGSSGRLRAAFGTPAPGDVRRCLVALGASESPWTEAFEYRFAAGELAGHALGNLVIAGLAESMGDFEAAVTEAGRLVGAVGRVLPATTGAVILTAEIDGRRVVGQVEIAAARGPISRITLVPATAGSPVAGSGLLAGGMPALTAAEAGGETEAPLNVGGPASSVGLDEAEPAAPAEAVAAIEAADQVVLGPGSLYTSVLAVLAVPALRRALAARSGGRVYVCNLRPQVPETAGFDAGAHLRALRDHGIEVDQVVYDPATMRRGHLDVPVVVARLTRADGLAHDPEALAKVLGELAVEGSYRLR